MEIVKVYSAQNEMESNMLTSTLMEQGIPCYSCEAGVGEYLKITQGFSIFGNDIYVADSDKSTAKSIIAQAIRDSALEVAPEDEIDMNAIPWYKNRTTLVRIILGVGISATVLVFLLSQIL